jgi:hypothetical protein
MDVLTSGPNSNRERLSTNPVYYQQRNSLVKRNIHAVGKSEEQKTENLPAKTKK